MKRLKVCFNMNTEEFLNYTGDFGPSMTGSCRPGCITGMWDVDDTLSAPPLLDIIP